jgi:hypothetical protein
MMPDSKTCPTCGGAPHDVSLPKRNGVCKTCGGRIYHYPPPDPITAGSLGISVWAHVERADWVDNPHAAEPEENA